MDGTSRPPTPTPDTSLSSPLVRPDQPGEELLLPTSEPDDSNDGNHNPVTPSQNNDDDNIKNTSPCTSSPTLCKTQEEEEEVLLPWPTAVPLASPAELIAQADRASQEGSTLLRLCIDVPIPAPPPLPVSISDLPTQQPGSSVGESFPSCNDDNDGSAITKTKREQILRDALMRLSKDDSTRTETKRAASFVPFVLIALAAEMVALLDMQDSEVWAWAMAELGLGAGSGDDDTSLLSSSSSSVAMGREGEGMDDVLAAVSGCQEMTTPPVSGCCCSDDSCSGNSESSWVALDGPAPASGRASGSPPSPPVLGPAWDYLARGFVFEPQPDEPWDPEPGAGSSAGPERRTGGDDLVGDDDTWLYPPSAPPPWFPLHHHGADTPPPSANDAPPRGAEPQRQAAAAPAMTRPYHHHAHHDFHNHQQYPNPALAAAAAAAGGQGHSQTGVLAVPAPAPIVPDINYSYYHGYQHHHQERERQRQRDWGEQQQWKRRRSPYHGGRGLSFF